MDALIQRRNRDGTLTAQDLLRIGRCLIRLRPIYGNGNGNGNGYGDGNGYGNGNGDGDGYGNG